MTTADIMFAQPGNPENLRDHEYETRTVLFALLAAILIHLFVAFFLAAFGGVFSPATPVEDKPSELTFMDLAPAVPKNSAFVETDESKKAPEPKEKTFESNANSIGASELAAAGQLPLPSQTGRINHSWIWRHISTPSTSRARWHNRAPRRRKVRAPRRRPKPNQLPLLRRSNLRC